MKVLFSTYPMAFHTPGGGEMQLLKYKQNLELMNIKVDFFDLWNPNFLNYNIFHFFSCISGSNHLCNFVKELGIPIVISSSLWLSEKNKHLYPLDEIRSHLLLANTIITNSYIESKQLSVFLDIPINSFAHVYNGVDSSFSKDVNPSIFRDKFNIYEPFLLNVGNIERRKNQLALAKAAKDLNIKLVLIGYIRDHNYANEIFSLYSDNVKYLGYIEHSELLISAYKACEVFCLPSALETPGLAAIEAATAGAKLVLTSEGSTHEYFGDFANYVDPDSDESIKHVIENALSLSITQSFDQSRFDWGNVVKKLADMYNKVSLN
jgi:glycosyltransferase involved in cell wall biosynthesis